MQPTAQAVGELRVCQPAQEGRKNLIPDISLIIGHVILLKGTQRTPPETNASDDALLARRYIL